MEIFYHTLCQLAGHPCLLLIPFKGTGSPDEYFFWKVSDFIEASSNLILDHKNAPKKHVKTVSAYKKVPYPTVLIFSIF
jgi:hypothetical protein